MQYAYRFSFSASQFWQAWSIMKALCSTTTLHKARDQSVGLHSTNFLYIIVLNVLSTNYCNLKGEIIELQG